MLFTSHQIKEKNFSEKPKTDDDMFRFKQVKKGGARILRPKQKRDIIFISQTRNDEFVR